MECVRFEQGFFFTNYTGIKRSEQQRMHKEQECCSFNEFEQAGYISLWSTQRCCTIFQYLTVALLSAKSQLLFIDKRNYYLKANS